MLKKLALLVGLTLSFLGQAMAQQSDNPDTIVVLDVSNSMWGQIDGVSKIEIARAVVADLLGDLETSSNFGLMAYGHRRKSDCSDIELILPVGPLEPEAFSAAVNQLTPRGRTPLTEAVRQAAEILNYSSRSGRVVLVSDGIESCDADPCALAQELAQNGLDFTTHVIGFDVADVADQSQLSCLAEATGGLYLTAESTEELGAALMTMMSDPDTLIDLPVGPQITLVAVDTQGNPVTDPNIIWNIDHIPSGDNWLTNEQAASVTIEFGAAPYRGRADLGNRHGELLFDFDGEQDATFVVVLSTPISLDAPDRVVADTDFEVRWHGTSAQGDTVVLMLDDATIASAPADNSPPATLHAPDQAGLYQLRYLAADGKVMDSAEIGIYHEASLNAPQSLTAGADIEITWTGPDLPGDYITIVPQGAPDGDYTAYEYSTKGSPLTLLATDSAGAYELRYMLGSSNTVLARRAITLTAPIVTLTTPPEAVAGATIDVIWTGPDNARDYITIVETGAEEGAYNGYTYTSEGSPLRLQTVDAQGDFEIRYVSGQSDRTLASQPITLTGAQVSLTAPPEAVAGAKIEVTWTGPDNARDYVTIVEVGAEDRDYGNYTYTSEGSPLQITTIDRPGNFELRYISGQSKAVLARLHITLTATPVTLNADPVAVAGSRVSVTWVGPDNPRDYITIVEAGAEDRDYGNYTYTSQGSPLVVEAVDSGGAYEIRYISGQSKTVLARLPLTLTMPEVALLAEPTAVAGTQIDVVWIGPGNRGDFITIVPVGAASGTYGTYAYTRDDPPLQVQVPETVGAYEIRYVSGQSKATWAAIPVTVVAE